MVNFFRLVFGAGVCATLAAGMFVTGCGRGLVATNPTPTPTPGPTPQGLTAGIKASPATINAGDLSTITWTSSNATSVTIVPAIPQEDVSTTPLNGQGVVTPQQTTTYTITAKGPGGTTTASTTVTVNQVAPTAQISALPNLVAAGGSATLSWSTSNATSLTIDHGIGSVTPLSGSVSTGPLSQTTTFTATATGPSGLTATATVKVSVSTLAVTLSASPTNITTPGQAVTLSWTSNSAVSVSIDQGVGTVTPTGGGNVTVNPTATTVYTATATDSGGNTATAKAVVSSNGTLSNINHIIWLVQENRSFDSYFGKLGLYRASKSLPKEINGVENDSAVTLNDLQGNPRHPYHYTTVCTENLTPAWNESHYDVDNGNMDNFMLTTLSINPQFDPSGSRAMGYYDQRDLPYYYELATQFATSDSMFSPVLANTIPNRMYLFTATSYGTIYPGSNPTTGQPEYNPASYQQKTIFDLLNQNNISWRYYYQDNSVFLASFSDWTNPDGSANTAIQGHVYPISDYYSVLSQPNADQMLPQVVFIERGGGDPHAGGAGTDEHPDQNTQIGAAAGAQMINALMASTAWPDSVFLLTYDEGGGLYDHVPPITLPAPDSIPPDTQNVPFTVLPGDFMHSGFRVPFVVVSPWVVPNYVSHVPSDTTSILKFIEKRFNLPSLTGRDGSSAVSDLHDFFDFTTPHLLTPPPLPSQPTNGTCDVTQESGP